MTDPKPDPSNLDLPPGIPAPPPPRPDLKDPRNAGPTYGALEKGKKKKKPDRTHPTDAYPPLKRKRGCGGCCGCLGGFAALLFLLLIAGGSLVARHGPGRYVSEGYTVVNLEKEEAIVDTAPTEATFYIAPGKITYTAPITNVPVAFMGRELEIEGDFLEATSLTGVKIKVTDKSRFAKDLEVIAAEFTDLGMTLKGGLTGRVIKNLP